MLYGFLNSEPLMCSDVLQEKLQSLNEELEYWRNDLAENQKLYRESKLDKWDDSFLNERSKAIKEDYKKTIWEGRANVYSSRWEIEKVKTEIREWNNREIVVLKTNTDNTPSSSNNK